MFSFFRNVVLGLVSVSVLSSTILSADSTLTSGAKKAFTACDYAMEVVSDEELSSSTVVNIAGTAAIEAATLPVAVATASALGVTAGTGTAIATLSGAAATSATAAAIGAPVATALGVTLAPATVGLAIIGAVGYGISSLFFGD